MSGLYPLRSTERLYNRSLQRVRHIQNPRVTPLNGTLSDSSFGRLRGSQVEGTIQCRSLHSLESGYPGNYQPSGVKQAITTLVKRMIDIAIFPLHMPKPWVLLKYGGLKMVQGTEYRREKYHLPIDLFAA